MPRSAAWQTLANYESQDLVRRRYNQRFSRTLSADAAKEIRSSISQAREYFNSASTADRTVKPLLLYYGSLGLARALVMFLKGVRESTLSASHGLQTGDWSGVFAAANPDVGTISIRTLAHGAFAEFVNATSNISLLTANSSKPNFAYPHPSIAVGTSISLNDLVSRIPEIGEQYTRWQGLPNFCPVDMQSSPPTADVRVNQKLHGLPVDRAFVESFFNTSTLVFQSDQNNQFWYKVSNKISDLPPLWDHRNQAFGIVGDYVLLKNFGGQQFSKASAILALAYVMGMLVRYYPSKWMSLVRNEIGDAGVPTILAAIDYVEETFPQSILEFFERDLLGV